MPANQHNINLIRTKSDTSSQIEAIESSVRKTSTTALIIFLCISVIVGSVYGLYFYKENSQEVQKAELISRVNSLKNKEAYLLAIKDRTKTVEKVMGNQKPWVQMLDLVNTFAAPPNLTSITVDEQDKIAITLRAASLEDVLSTVKSIQSYVETNKIKNPQLVSFQITKTEQYELSISFYAVFSNI